MTRTLPLLVLALLTGFSYAATAETAYAHGGPGMNFTSTTTAGYIVDVDYSDTPIEAGRIGRFDFRLFTDKTWEKAVDFTDIWVRIVEEDGSKAGRTLFAGSISKQEFGGNGFSYVFPKKGTYTLSLRYNDARKGDFGETIGEAEFELSVLRSPNENTFTFGIEFWIGLLTGLFGAVITILPLFVRGKKN